MFLGTFLSSAIFLLLISVVNPSYSSFFADANNKFGNQPYKTGENSPTLNEKKWKASLIIKR